MDLAALDAPLSRLVEVTEQQPVVTLGQPARARVVLAEAADVVREGEARSRGEHGTPIVFFKLREVDDKAAANDDERRVVPLLDADLVDACLAMPAQS